MAEMEDLSRQRLDYFVGSNGQTIATLTVTLGDGSVRRYTAESTTAEVAELAKGIAEAEMRERELAGELQGKSQDQVTNMFRSIVNSVKAVREVERRIASSKAFRMAGEGLTADAPRTELPAVALAIGAGMIIASKLSDASIAADAEAKRVSQALAAGAKTYAGEVSRDSSEKLLNWGNEKRKAMDLVATTPRGQA